MANPKVFGHCNIHRSAMFDIIRSADGPALVTRIPPEILSKFFFCYCLPMAHFCMWIPFMEGGEPNKKVCLRIYSFCVLIIFMLSAERRVFTPKRNYQMRPQKHHTEIE